jgi:hypothetical protein
MAAMTAAPAAAGLRDLTNIILGTVLFPYPAGSEGEKECDPVAASEQKKKEIWP